MFNNETFTTIFRNNNIEIEDIKDLLLGKYLGWNSEIDIDDINVETTNTAILDYSFSAEVRSWGIKSIYVDIRKFSAEIEWSIDKDFINQDIIDYLLENNPDATEHKNEIIGVIKVDNIKDWDITNEVEFESDGGYHFDMVYINLQKKEISFNN
jgi:hypothetical protein